MATSRDETPPVGLEGLDTPCLILDAERLGRNAARMRARCAGLGVTLRPHLKTAKSLDVARVATGGAFGPVTVSTLKEADYFARGGYRDILYAVAIAPAKLRRVGEMQAGTGARILLVVDSIPAARALAAGAPGWSPPFECLIEVDCGEHRSGVQPMADALLPIARALVEGGAVLQGVITHAGHSYSSSEPSIVEAIAEDERSTAVTAAGILAAAGLPCPIISVGSTPTVQFAHHLDGVTEARCGIYMFWDLAQLSRNVCAYDDIAVSVLATVIGHNRGAAALIVDAGALALSKDIGANTHLPDAKYGYVCDAATLDRLGGLSVDAVHQEHGTIQVADPGWFARLPIGSPVRILPNHACLTCSAYDQYNVLEGDMVTGRWPRTNGW